MTAAPAAAQIATTADCARMPNSTEEIACLRHALEQSREALRGKRDEDSKHPAPELEQPVDSPVAASQQAARPGLGAEQVRTGAAHREPQQRLRRVSATVTRTSTDARGLLTLQLDNGQIWQQAEKSGVPLLLRPDGHYSIEISGSGFGGYRMHFSDSGRMLVVRRLR
jgi:hypothetical protein